MNTANWKPCIAFLPDYHHQFPLDIRQASHLVNRQASRQVNHQHPQAVYPQQLQRVNLVLALLFSLLDSPRPSHQYNLPVSLLDNPRPTRVVCQVENLQFSQMDNRLENHPLNPVLSLLDTHQASHLANRQSSPV